MTTKSPRKKSRSNSGEPVTTPGSASDPLPPTKHFPNDPLARATQQDKSRWAGFVERESEPAFFNALIRDLGVQGARMQEVFGLGDDLLAFVEKPIYGVLFLYQWHAKDSTLQESECPTNVWFANQVQENACSTMSLLNLVNNVHGLKLGDKLQKLKGFTMDFNPYMRGTVVNNSEHVRTCHNSLARKMQMLVEDKGLQERFDNRKKSIKGAKRPKRTLKRKHSDEDAADEDAAYHYAAYVPINGHIWMLDGMERQPEDVATIPEGQDWMEALRPVLEQEMALVAGEGDLAFNLMALVRDPILAKTEELAANIKALGALEGRLAEVNPDWEEEAERSSQELDEHVGALRGAACEFQLSAEQMEETRLPEGLADQMAGEDVGRLIERQKELVSEQDTIRMRLQLQQADGSEEEKRTEERASDYSELIHTWLSMLAQKEDVLRELIEEE